MKNVQKIHPAWIILGFLLAIPGGIPGIIIGIYIAVGKYNKFTRITGIIIVVLNLIMTYTWFFSLGMFK